MQRRVLAMVVLALLLAAVPTAAQAKGASAATISGGGPGGLPGGPIDLKGDGEPGSGTDLANLAASSGVFALLFEDSSSGALATAPPGARGPRYTITWTFPNGAGTENKVRQSVWPYAVGPDLHGLRPAGPGHHHQGRLVPSRRRPPHEPDCPGPAQAGRPGTAGDHPGDAGPGCG